MAIRDLNKNPVRFPEVVDLKLKEKSFLFIKFFGPKPELPCNKSCRHGHRLMYYQIVIPVLHSR
jgi:hypothetical protein